MTLTVEQALSQIANIDATSATALDEIESILGQVAGSSPSQSIFYSGDLSLVEPKRWHSGRIAQGLAEAIGEPASKLEGVSSTCCIRPEPCSATLTGNLGQYRPSPTLAGASSKYLTA